MPMDKQTFCERLVYLDRRLISFQDRPYLSDIYASDKRNLVLRCSRQTEKSTFLANSILYEACTNPGISMLLVTPREQQSITFCRARLLPCLARSPLLQRELLGAKRQRPALHNMSFDNGSILFVRSAFQSADSCRGLSVRRLYIDEYQDIAADNLPVLQETLSHAKDGRTILTGTPKSIDNHLEAAFALSTANEWSIGCGQCGRPVILDESCLGPHGIVCPNCQTPLDPRRGEWVSRNPASDWGDGFWICHPMVPWMDYKEILDKQRCYDLVCFKNECLGLPSTHGDHIVSREELEACCDSYQMARSITDVPTAYREQIFAGLDWGGGGTSKTVLVVGFIRPDNVFQICLMKRFPHEDPVQILPEAADCCRRFQVRAIGADGGGNGHVYNRMLFDHLQRLTPLYAFFYSSSEHQPQRDGELWRWTVDRSRSIGAVFSRVKKNLLVFPNLRQSDGFLDDFACVVLEYDDDRRAGRFTHPHGMCDDALHATNYATILGTRHLQRQYQVFF